MRIHAARMLEFDPAMGDNDHNGTREGHAQRLRTPPDPLNVPLRTPERATPASAACVPRLIRIPSPACLGVPNLIHAHRTAGSLSMIRR